MEQDTSALCPTWIAFHDTTDSDEALTPTAAPHHIGTTPYKPTGTHSVTDDEYLSPVIDRWMCGHELPPLIRHRATVSTVLRITVRRLWLAKLRQPYSTYSGVCVCPVCTGVR